MQLDPLTASAYAIYSYETYQSLHNEEYFSSPGWWEFQFSSEGLTDLADALKDGWFALKLYDC